MADVVAARHSIQLQVKSSLAQSQQRMKDLINPSRRAVEYSVGDQAWLSTLHLPIRHGARKLAAKWAGPFPVVKRVGKEAYGLKLPPAWKVHPVFHTSQLKEVTGQFQPEAPVVLEDQDPEHEAERIVDVRVVHGSR